METDAEHQKDDSDFGEFRRQSLIGDKSGREGTDNDAGGKVTKERGKTKAVGDGAKQESKTDCGDEGSQQRGTMRHWRVRKSGADGNTIVRVRGAAGKQSNAKSPSFFEVKRDG